MLKLRSGRFAALGNLEIMDAPAEALLGGGGDGVRSIFGVGGRGKF